MLKKFFILVLFLFSEAVFGLDEIQNCEIEYYDIQGKTAKKLLEEMKTKNKIQGGFFGYTQYSYKNDCSELTTTCRTRVPRWIDFEESANQSLKEKWTTFYNALINHEQGHVDIFREYMKTAQKKSLDKSCVVSNEIFSSAFKSLSKKQIQFDKETNHGMNYGAFFDSSAYQSIAFSQQTGQYGFTYDYSSKEESDQVALEYCNAPDCKLVIWSRDACATLATGEGNGFGTSWSVNQEDSEKKALELCKKNNTNCKILKTTCPSS